MIEFIKSVKIVDTVIFVLIAMFAVIGMKRGFLKQTVMTVGTILVLVLAYSFKDGLANWFSYNLPFFKFSGQIAGLTTLNIIMYQMIAFAILISLLAAVLVVLEKVTGGIEKFLNFTIILAIPSKILGFILGLIEGYIIVFIGLFFLSQPTINIDILNESKYMPKIVNSSPVLSRVVRKTGDSISEIYDLGKDYIKDKDANKFNKNSIDIMLKNKIISVKYVDKLIEKDKLEISGINPVLDKYR